MIDFYVVAKVVAPSSFNIPTVVVQDVANSQPARASYMKTTNRVLPALPLQPVVLKRRGKTGGGFRCLLACFFLIVTSLYFKFSLCVWRMSFTSVFLLGLAIFDLFYLFCFVFFSDVVLQQLPSSHENFHREPGDPRTTM